MAYHLISGATGLLGRYLLRDLTLADRPVAVLVRPTRKISAEDRIEAIMQRWDAETGQTLPRPAVLESDLCEPNLGLSEADIAWIASNVESFVHSAASLSFIATSSESEPWRSNVGGTQNVLDLCQQTGIRNLHHVSTAYVCGLRTGRILESDVDVGQESANDYEKSKLAAEKMVRSAQHIETLTVHRPAIIIGDSQTGFTNTFHGFYAALQLGYTLAQMQELDDTGIIGGTARFTLNGSESKNLIPVDWVSAVMAHVITHPEHHGKTYHLTPRHAVHVRLVRDVLEEAGGFYGARFCGANTVLEHPTEVERLFYEHIRVYNSYWRDDPQFDCTNTRAAAPHLPAPHVDRDMLLRLSRIAIGMNFTWNDRPRKKSAANPTATAQ